MINKCPAGSSTPHQHLCIPIFFDGFGTGVTNRNSINNSVNDSKGKHISSLCVVCIASVGLSGAKCDKTIFVTDKALAYSGNRSAE